MEFLDKLGQKASMAYKITTDKTGKIARETKLKMKMNELKSEINDVYKEIGQTVYQKHLREEEYDISEQLNEQFTKIDMLSDEIDSCLKECLSLKDKKQCPNCYFEIEKHMNYCPNCGKEQEKDMSQKEEITVEENKKEINNDINNNSEDLENNNSENLEKANLEKTIEVESDVNTEDEA